MAQPMLLALSAMLVLSSGAATSSSNRLESGTNETALAAAAASGSAASGWQAVSTIGSPNGRDEAGYYEWDGQMCMFGGRFVQPIDCYDPNTRKWTRSKTVTDNLHHIQPVIWCTPGTTACEVYVVASWHGNWPDTERNTDHVVIYNPATDSLRNGSAIPPQFQRGAAGAVVHADLIYVVNGACNGHLAQFGAKAFRGLSTYDPRSGAWKQLPAPRYNRDHFDAVLVDDSKLVVASGRDTPRGCTTSNKDPEGFNCTGRPNIFHYTVAPVEVFDLRTGQWSVGANITTPRAGAMALVAPFDGTAQRVVVAGGERDTQQDGFRTVEAYDPATNDWVSMPSMIVGRHTGGLMLGNKTAEGAGATSRMIAASGVGHMGGDPLLTDTEEWDY